VKTSNSHPDLSRLGPQQRLALYGLAAGAALAAGASSAHANLITLDLTGLTLADRTTPTFGALYFDVNAASAAAAVSFNPFAGADFRLSHTQIPFASATGLAPGNGIQGFRVEGFKASRLTTSNFVSSDHNFNSRANIAPVSPWGPGDTGFLGLVFTITGSDTHFGWANITANPDASVTLNALGYESSADTPAHAEAPSGAVPDQGSTLALLATGAVGLLAFRKHQRKAA
jgi:hypothetical protein